MLSASHCDKCGGAISERTPWHKVEFICWPRQNIPPQLEILEHRAEYHATCFACWESFPYLMDGEECQLPKRSGVPSAPSCDGCDQKINIQEPHFCILSTLIVDGWSAENRALGLFCAKCVEGKGIELIRSAEGGEE